MWCLTESNIGERRIDMRNLKRPMALAIRRSLVTFNRTSHCISQLMKTKLSAPKCIIISAL